MKRSLRHGFWAVVLAFLFLLTGCSPEETGAITLLTPANGEVFRDDYLGAPLLTKPLVVASTYETAKMVKFQIAGQDDSLCLVTGGASHAVCPALVLSEPGEYTVTVEVAKQDGSTDRSYFNFKWVPYSETDKIMLGLSYTSTPVGGYVMVLGILLLILLPVVWFFVRDIGKSLLVGAIMVLLFAFAVISVAAMEFAVATSCLLVPIFVALLFTGIYQIRLPKPTLVATTEEGNLIRYLSRPRKGATKRVEIETRDLNRDLMFEINQKGGNDAGSSDINSTRDID